MAFPTSVNSQITDSVTQANVKVVGDAPALTLANFYQATAQALSNAAHNATTAQTQAGLTSQAAAARGVATLLSIDTASTGVATAAILMGSGVTDANLARAAGEPDVVALHLGGFSITPTGVEYLQSMRQLQYLHLGDLDVSDAQLSALRAALPSTEIHHLSECG